jgi:hypothetical protein
MTDATRHPDALRLSDTWGRQDKFEIACPTCGDSYVHPLFTEIRNETTDSYTSPAGERGSWIEIPMACEHCDFDSERLHPGFSVVIAFHKGQTFLSVLKG